MLFYYLLSTTSSNFHTTLKKIYIKRDKRKSWQKLNNFLYKKIIFMIIICAIQLLSYHNFFVCCCQQIITSNNRSNLCPTIQKIYLYYTQQLNKMDLNGFFSLKYIYILERKENKTIKFDHYYGNATIGKDLQELKNKDLQHLRNEIAIVLKILNNLLQEGLVLNNKKIISCKVETNLQIP